MSLQYFPADYTPQLLQTLQLEFEVVTPSGQHVFANECQFSDLFFALRGGGGGTFGVVLGATTLALPQMEITV